MKNKIKLNDLIDRKRNIVDWANPKKYTLNFRFPKICRYCGKPFLSNTVTLYDKKYICNCPNCGGRHNINEKVLKRWCLSEKFLKVTISILCVAICVSSIAAYLAESGYMDKILPETTMAETQEPTTEQVETDFYNMPSTLKINAFSASKDVNAKTLKNENGYKLPPMIGSASSNYNIKLLEIYIYSEDKSLISKESKEIAPGVKSISFVDYNIDYSFEENKIYKIQYIVTDESTMTKASNYIPIIVGNE